MSEDKISSPFQKGVMGSGPEEKGCEGVYDHHPSPAFNKPRSGGNDLPLKFASNLKGNAANISSPFTDAEGIHKKG